jgi:hypothetical protein
MNGQAFSLNEPSWSPAEKKIARKAFDQALTRQCGAIAAKAKTMMMAASTPQDLWEIHDYLSEQRRIVDQSYDYRYSVLLTVFASLLSKGWLTLADLAGLHEDKLKKIDELAKFGSKPAYWHG